MKKRQLMAILLSAVMTVSTCMPSTGISAFAAENADIGSTEAAVEEVAAEEAAQEEAATEESAPAESVEDPAPAAEQEVDSATEEAPETEAESEDAAETEDKEEAESEEAAAVESSEDEQTEESAADPAEEAAQASTEESASAPEEEPAQTEAEETAAEDADAAATVSAPEEKPAPEQEAEVVEEDAQESASKKAQADTVPSENAYANAQDIAVGDSKSVAISSSNPYACFKFTPETSGNYRFYSESDDDTYGEVYNSTQTRLFYNDDGGDNSNFLVEAFLIGGKTYYLAARFYNTDNSGQFTVHLENGEEDETEFYVEGGGTTQTVYAMPGSTVELSVNAYSTSELTYTWYDNDGNDLSVNASTYTFEANDAAYYSCTVTDGNSSGTVFFNIQMQTHLTAYPEGGEEGDDSIDLSVSPNSELTLKVIASADEGVALTYEWQKDYSTIDGADSDSYTTSSVTERADYQCTVSDPYGNSKTIYFYVSVDSHLTAYPEGGEEGDDSIDLSVSPNSELTLKVIASADEGVELTYEWDKSWSTIDGATSDSYTISSVTERATYRCTVSDPYGNSKTIYFYVSVDSHLTAYPEGGQEGNSSISLKVSPNSELTLKVIASADEGVALTYEWDKNLDEIDGADSDSYTISSVTESATYRCFVSDSYGNSKTIYFHISVDSHLTAYPEGGQEGDDSIDLSVAPNSELTLKVIASADEGVALTYEWDKNWDVIDGADSDSYTISSVTGRATYHCTVSDSYGNSETIDFYVSVDSHLTAYPEGGDEGDDSIDLSVAPNSELTLKVIASADEGVALTYEWQKDYSTIDGADSDSYTISSVTKSATYWCTVSDSFGNSRTIYFYVSVENHFNAYPEGGDEDDNSITLYVEPEDVGKSLDLKVNVTGDDLENVTYRWFDYDTDEDIDGAESASYTIESVSKNCEYYCNVSDQYGNTKEVCFNIEVQNHLTAYPEGGDEYDTSLSLDVSPESSVTMRVIASADDVSKITYTWYDDWELISGATSDSYTISSVKKSGTYQCKVEDQYGNQVTVYFHIHIETHLNAYPEGGDENDDSITLTVAPESSLSLHVIATADEGITLTYEWEKYYSTISGETTEYLNIASVTEEARYRCTVSDQYGNDDVVTFYVSPDNELQLRQDENSGIYNTERTIHTAPGQSVELKLTSVSALKDNNLKLQWYKDGESISGATSTVYTAPGTQTADYSCKVTDPYGCSATTIFHVIVDNMFDAYIGGYGDQRTGVDIDISDAVGKELKTVVSATDPDTVKYKWSARHRFEDDYDYWYEYIEIEGADSSTYVIKDSDLDTNSPQIRCTISDDYGNSQELYYYIPYDVDIYPEGAYYYEDEGLHSNYSYIYNENTQNNVTLKVITEGDTFGALTYSWYDCESEKDIEATSDSIEVPSPTDGYCEYRCRVSNSHGMERTVYFDVYSRWLRAYTNKDTHDDYEYKDIAPGEEYTMTPVVEGNNYGTLTYEWYLDNKLIDGETGTSLTVKPERNCRYRCEITGENDLFDYVNYNFSMGTISVASATDGAELIKGRAVNDKQYSVNLTPGTTVELKNTVNSTYGTKLSYEWEDYDSDVLVSTKESLTITPNKSRNYRCYITDEYGNYGYVYYYVYVNHLTAKAVQSEVHYNPDTSDGCTLQVSVTADDTSKVTYRWEDGSSTIEKTGDSIFVNPGFTETYYCYVSDGYGNEIQVYFEVIIDSDLTIKPTGTGDYDSDENLLTIISVEGTALTLNTEVTASSKADLAYNWKYHELDTLSDSSDAWVNVDGSTGSLDITFNKDVRYVCTVTDQYGHSEEASFDIAAGERVSDSDITVKDNLVYNGKTQNPISIKHDGKTLTVGTDYTIKYSASPVNAGDYTATLTFLGDYKATGTKTVNFSIAKAAQTITLSPSTASVVVGQTQVFTVSAQGTPSCEVEDTAVATATVSGKEITVTGVEAGTTNLKVTAAETANYKATEAQLELNVVPGKTTRGDLFNLANNIKITWKAVPGAKYYKVYRNGVKDPVVVTTGLVGWDTCTSPALQPGTMYTYKIVASTTGKGDSSGDSPLSYSKKIYRLKTTAFKYIKNIAAGKVRISYKKSAYGDSYVLLYSDNKEMKNAKSKVIYGANTTVVDLGGFKKGKTYYFQIRVRKKVDGVSHYTTFGVIKSVKITK